MCVRLQSHPPPRIARSLAPGAEDPFAYALARPGSGRGARGRGNSRGSPAGRASGLALQPCWPVCSRVPSSSAGDGGYPGRGKITSGNPCTCGGVPGPCVPSCEGGHHRPKRWRVRARWWSPSSSHSSISTAQPSAPPRAECRRLDRWILAKTKLALRARHQRRFTRPRGAGPDPAFSP